MQAIPVRHIKSSIKEPDTSEEFIIWSLSDLLSGKDMVQELHRHSFYFILIIENGTGDHIIDFTPCPVNSQSVHIMRPGQVHELKLQSDCKGYLLQFTDEFCLNYDTETKQILKKISRKDYYLSESDTFEKIVFFMKTIFQEASRKEFKHRYAIRTNLQLFFVELYRQGYSSVDIPDEETSYRLERLEVFRELIAEHNSNHKQVRWYAGKMNLTVYQLNSITKTILGKSSSEIINDYILLEAKRYLLATTNQINQISWYLGYEDVSYFIRFFKKHMGYSPEAFRSHFK
ncbi:helix-turn-helix transcriptional regulator [Chryseobacterium sp. EO14]|uniref:helix-turn-helix transcriptional regulator n=1 Tax=Chryseobacterium sp. EO14 TaxID=2950551 RepID=UPI00210B3BEB|nr:helix-turn-helix transcriptional regulator [Chryseobacterium sp. EO14]MCQ4141903.1 helix-turn-helix transcriptional regulator [Chryseobacterium sp. EO14]